MQYNHLSKEELLIEIDKLKAKVTEFEKSEIIRLSAEQRNIQAENELLESEKKYKRLFEKSEDAILILQNGRFVDCNNAAIKMLRFDKKEEFLNTHPSELSPEKQRDGKMSFSKADEMIEIAFKNGSHRFEWDHKKSDGEIFPVEVLLTVIENTEKLQIIHTVWRDISKRKQFENTIKESEERFKRLFDDLGDAVFVTRIGKANMGKIVEANAAAVIQTGYSREELLKMNIVYDLCIPGTGIISTDDWNEKLYKGDKVTNTEKKRKKDGSEYWTEVIVTPIEFKGEIAGLSINHDITSRKKAEDDLRESEEKYRTLIDNIQDGVFIINEGKLLFVNEAFAAIVGYTKDEVSGMDFKKFVAPEDWRMVLVNYAKMMQGESDINNLEFQAIHKDGFTRVYVNMTIDRINYDNKPVAFGTVKDISENKKMQELITLKEKYYRTLFDLSPTGIIVIDDKGFILDINESFCKYNGYTPAELKGANISILVPEDKQRDMDMHIKEILIGKNLRDEVINISKDGSPRNIELYETKVTLSDGQSGILSIANDITERTRTANVQNVIYKISYAVNLTDNLDELISIIREGLSTLIDTANFFVAIYEEETDTILLPYIADKKDTFTSFPAGKSLTAHVIKSKKPLFATKEVVAEMESKGIIESVGSDSEIWLGVPMILRDKVTGAIVVQSYDDENAYSLQDMEILDFVSQAISLSINRKKAEQDLLSALEKATESDRLKSTFLATMSHELRTPLNAIIGFSEIIDEEMPIHEILEFNKTINNSGMHLLSIVKDIFDISLIETGEIQIEKKENKLKSILKNIHEIIQVEQQNTNKTNLKINLIIPSDNSELVIYTDASKLKQILINLLKNAIKFTREGHINYGYIIESIKDKPMLKFFVEDTGIGIPKNMQSIIFDMFRQVEDAHTRIYGGTGIGLTISKKVCELLGGELWVESEEGVGSVFYFTIPLEGQFTDNKIGISKKAKIKTEANDKIKLQNKTILIVEDDEPSFEYLKIVLEKSGFAILWAKNGLDAINFCTENQDIGLVLMDINMPDMNGYIATIEIKKLKPDLPVIAQTAYAISGDRSKALDVGCDDYISKPIDKNKLLEIIEMHLFA